MQRPTFFLSSTIYDFRDLRGALKFYLEEQGCKVLASEFNDFEKPLDQHSYQACLDAIHSVDYFILLIGSRVGGWFDEPNRISITQREYREAYDLHRGGKLKIFSFVRADVWQVKEERRELTKYLEAAAVEDSLKKDIANFPSKAATDANFISSFLSEVGRNKETLHSVRTGAPAPTGNWINVFTDFRDIVRVLDSTLFASTPMEDVTMRRLLRRELRNLLAETLVKFKGGIRSPRGIIDRFHEETNVVYAGDESEHTTVKTSTWNALSSFSIHLLGVQLHPLVLGQAIASATFLEFDLNSNAYKETPVYESLLQLQEEIRLLGRANSTDVMSVVYKHSPRNQPHRGATLEINTTELVKFLHLMDRWANIVALAHALVKHLDGASYVRPDLRPRSPIRSVQQSLEEERIQDEELDRFIVGGASAR